MNYMITAKFVFALLFFAGSKKTILRVKRSSGVTNTYYPMKNLKKDVS